MSGVPVSPVDLSKRTAKDSVWGVLYVGSILATAVIGYYGVEKSNFDELRNPPTQCAGGFSPSPGGGTGSDTILNDIASHAKYLILAVPLSVALGIVWMALLRSCARPIVCELDPLSPSLPTPWPFTTMPSDIMHTSSSRNAVRTQMPRSSSLGCASLALHFTSFMSIKLTVPLSLPQSLPSTSFSSGARGAG